MLSFIHRYLLDLLFPENCLGCGRQNERLCARCLDDLPSNNAQEKGVYSVFSYQTPLIKEAIWRLKYKGEKRIALALGQELYRRARPRLDLPANQPFTVIPIPSSRQRLTERGFNQAALVARAFAGREPSRFQFTDRVLIKIKDTPAQVATKSRAARLANLAGAFTVRDHNLIAGRTIILIDDVTTTGGTMAEAKRTLREAGAKRVIGLTVARG
ncbi:MAG: ComF family protein [Candidatus Vogelbacteria bacterium]|nr:ComF family protein [Candidatus Vogelbacteria bacterium]